MCYGKNRLSFEPNSYKHGSRNYVSHIKRDFQNPVCSLKNTEAGGKLSKSFSSK